MADTLGNGRDLSALMVSAVGAVECTDSLWAPVRVVDAAAEAVPAVSMFLTELQARGRAVATQRSYAMDLLRWFRFCWAVGVPWDQATRVEARDFCVWLSVTTKPSILHGADVAVERRGRYAASTRAHAETVLRTFYDFHRDAGSGPMVNPFPLARASAGRANAHHNPMEPFRHERAGLYRPRRVSRIPRCMPDEAFNELFSRLGCDRDRALVALWVSTGARASELLGVCCGDVDPGQQLITVIRKGTRALQQVPASRDAFVWLRLYQCGLGDDVPTGRDDPVWWTRRRPVRRLTYPAARAMFARAAEVLDGRWTLHDLRHTAAYRMARDPSMPLTDVQWVLGHAHLSTTQLYVTPLPEDVIAAVLAHHQRRDDGTSMQAGSAPVTRRARQQMSVAPEYRKESLDLLFGRRDADPGRRSC
jgi:site-specific recombinase XerD